MAARRAFPYHRGRHRRLGNGAQCVRALCGSHMAGREGSLEVERTEVDLLLERIGLEGFGNTCAATAPVSFPTFVSKLELAVSRGLRARDIPRMAW